MKARKNNTSKQPDKAVTEGSSDRSGSKTAALQFEDNRPENAVQRRLKTLIDNGMTSEGFENRLASAAVQRKAYIGENYAQPEGQLSPEAQALVADDPIRRFKDKNELQKYAENETNIDNAGLTADGDWVRVDQFTVLGEMHGEKNANKIIKALGTKRFRYEGFAHLSAERLSKDPTLSRHMQQRVRESLEKLELDEQEAEARTHEAEEALPKYARVLPDAIELARQQAEDGAHQVVAGSQWPAGYSLAKALTKGLLDALMYARSFRTKFLGHPLKKFYSANTLAVEQSITILKEAEENEMVPNFSDLDIKPRLGSLKAAYVSAAKSKLGVSKASKLEAFKRELNLRNEMNVTLTDEAKELDYLRDLSMCNTIEASKENDDLLFVIGDAHRQKLAPLLKDMAVMRDKEFLEGERQKNDDASRGILSSERAEMDDAAKKAEEKYKHLVEPKRIGGFFRLSTDELPNCEWECVNAVPTEQAGRFKVTGKPVEIKLLWKKRGFSEEIYSRRLSSMV